MNFPDLGHLRQLQDDLWRWPKSRAAVMVGAGMSLNSEPLPGVHSKFPIWSELALAMFTELHPDGGSESESERATKEKKFLASNPLRVASEYEAAYGRSKLNHLIQSKNPDLDHVPGTLHKMLMALPWSDVFTTNYDTLLERTEVPGRAYQPVIKPTDLLTTFAPRIVKLHGSFPSQTPYIITEDDYRTYPAKFAPFVNTVQQSLIENAFVLLGFSGDDPNFLAWAGWIRDQLGENHAPIYLVGPLNLGTADRSLLTRRGVTPIDLSPLFSGKAPAGGIHAASIGWFLQCLQAAKPEQPWSWLDMESATTPKSCDLPQIISGRKKRPPCVDQSRDPREVLTGELVGKIVQRWRYERENYPGWLVLNDSKRDALWTATKYWISPLIEASKPWTVASRLLLFRELNWRYETAMIPLFPESIEPFGSAIEEHFPALLEGGQDTAISFEVPFASASFEDVADSWFQLTLALLREARETYKEGRWQDINARLDQVIERYPRFKDRHHYEQALWAMWRLERGEAKTILAKWQPTSRSPLSCMWKAGFLAELDELNEAKGMLRGALGEIRHAQNTQGRNTELLSLEGWCSYLLFGIEQAFDYRSWSALRVEFAERWNELKAWDCSPWPIKAFFEAALNGPAPKIPKSETRVRGFDPGAVSVRGHWTGDEIGDYLPAFACIRLYEQVGIPMRMRMLNMGSKTLAAACKWLAPFLDFGSPAVLIRAGNSEEVSESNFMSRTQIALMDLTSADRLHDWCARVLKRELDSLRRLGQLDSQGDTLLRVLPEVLSRIAFKVDHARMLESFELAILVSEQAATLDLEAHYEGSLKWFKRLFLAAEPPLLFQWLPVLLRLPLETNISKALEQKGRSDSDPMFFFPSGRLRDLGQTEADASNAVEDAISWLLLRMESESGSGRIRALNRITHLYEAGLLTVGQERRFGDLLWSDRPSNGLPNRMDLHLVSYVSLPKPEGEDVSALIKKYILDIPQRFAVDRSVTGQIKVNSPWNIEPLIAESALASKPLLNLYGEPKGSLEWTAEEADLLFRRSLAWWDNDKIALSLPKGTDPFLAFGVRHINRTTRMLGKFLCRTVLPYASKSGSEVLDKTESLISELREHEVFATVALPYGLLHESGRVEAFATILLADVESDQDERAAEASNAIRHWAHLAHRGLVPTLPVALLRAVMEKVAFRPRSGGPGSIHSLSLLLLERPELFQRSDVDWLAASLSAWHRVLEFETHSEQSRDFEEAEKPDMRVLIARLASAIQIWIRTGYPNDPENPAIALWRKSCAKDPLPEVRRAFAAWSDFQSWANGEG